MHMHTSFSDGNSSLEEMLVAAERKKLRYISITDHYSIGAYEKLKDSNIRKLFSGIIIPGAEWGFNNGGDFSSELLAYGIDVDSIERLSWGEPDPYPCNANRDRRHLLGRGTLEEVSGRIHKVGGLVFVAHPFIVRDWFDYACKKKLIDGVEVFYADQTREATDKLKEYCVKNGLLMSGGCDAHSIHGIGEKPVSKLDIGNWIDNVRTV